MRWNADNQPTEIFEQRFDYCAEVNRLDRSVKAVLYLLEKRGLTQQTLIVFAGDNGAALPHGKGSLYDLSRAVRSDHYKLIYNVSVVPSAFHRDLLRRIHRCHSLQIYDTYEVRRPSGSLFRCEPGAS